MKTHAFSLAVALLLAQPGVSQAQSQKLAHLLPTLYGPQGLFVDSSAPLPDGSTHSAHFTHDGAAPGGRADVVTTPSSAEASITQQIGFVTYGVGERLDASPRCRS
jgi:hypothetical protein